MIWVLLAYLTAPFILLTRKSRTKPKSRRILIIQTAKIGDMICSTPVFREIKKGLPEAHLTVLATPSTKGVLRGNPNVDEIIAISTSDYRGIAGKLKLAEIIGKGKYDTAVCLNPNTLFALALFWGLVPVRLTILPDFCGTTFKLASRLFTGLEKHLQGRLVAETYLKMLRHIGIESSNFKKEIFISEEGKSKAEDFLKNLDMPLVGIAVSSGNKLKELGVEKLSALVSGLLDSVDCSILLIGAGADKKTADTVIEITGLRKNVINSCGKFSLEELPGLIAKLAVFVGVDTGIAYMADALSIPVIDMAGPSDMQDQRPTGAKAVIIKKELPCVPCSHSFKSPYECEIGTRECIEDIVPEEIVAAVLKTIGAGK
ncbi:MAG: glycosyltransferase family 9 protein [Nitrospirae bacterium]|nr:MAG: glycosyltransferase family 9 protein [Nitrospirota bacterium]